MTQVVGDAIPEADFVDAVGDVLGFFVAFVDTVVVNVVAAVDSVVVAQLGVRGAAAHGEQGLGVHGSAARLQLIVTRRRGGLSWQRTLPSSSSVAGTLVTLVTASCLLL